MRLLRRPSRWAFHCPRCRDLRPCHQTPCASVKWVFFQSNKAVAVVAQCGAVVWGDGLHPGHQRTSPLCDASCPPIRPTGKTGYHSTQRQRCERNTAPPPLPTRGGVYASGVGAHHSRGYRPTEVCYCGPESDLTSRIVTAGAPHGRDIRQHYAPDRDALCAAWRDSVAHSLAAPAAGTAHWRRWLHGNGAISSLSR